MQIQHAAIDFRPPREVVIRAVTFFNEDGLSEQLTFLFLETSDGNHLLFADEAVLFLRRFEGSPAAFAKSNEVQCAGSLGFAPGLLRRLIYRPGKLIIIGTLASLDFNVADDRFVLDAMSRAAA